MPELDRTTVSIAKATVNGNEVNTNQGIREYCPFFLTKRLEGRMSFEVELVNVGSQSISIGLASYTLRGSATCYAHPDALTFNLFNGNITYLCSEGRQFVLPTQSPVNGWKILVNVDRQAGEVEWIRVHPIRQSLLREQIPVGMLDKTLLPVIHMWGNYGNIVKFV